jgi:hypothetical protein
MPGNRVGDGDSDTAMLMEGGHGPWILGGH